MIARWVLTVIAAVGSTGCLPTYLFDRRVDAATDAIDAVTDIADTTVDARDGNTGPDADASGDASVVLALGAPRPIAPLATSTVTSRRPTLHWALVGGSDGAHVQVCRDRACAMVVADFDASGSGAAPSADLPTGVVFWRMQSRAHGTTASLWSPTWQFTVGARTAPRDTSWGSTLDVNGDGFADVAVGAPDTNGSSNGRVFVYAGSATGIAATPTTFMGSGAEAFGDTIGSVGDVNGDGYGDLAVAGTNAIGFSGLVHVFLGGPTGLSPAPAPLSGPGGANGAFGTSLASAGDVNGDGFGDLVVGSASGVYVFFGSSSGLGPTPAIAITPPPRPLRTPGGSFGHTAIVMDATGDGFLDLIATSVDGDNHYAVFLYEGTATGFSSTPSVLASAIGSDIPFGTSLANAGDVDGDGVPDVVIAPLDLSSTNGEAAVYLGGSGLGTTFTALGAMPGGNFGSSVASAGDVNGDGFADVVVGASGAGSGAGKADIYLGSGMGIGRMTSDFIPGSDGPAAYFGSNVAGAGDVNRDGFADVIVGAPGANTGAGSAYVFVGGAGGLGGAPASTLTMPAGGSFGTTVADACRVPSCSALSHPLLLGRVALRAPHRPDSHVTRDLGSPRYENIRIRPSPSPSAMRFCAPSATAVTAAS